LKPPTTVTTSRPSRPSPTSPSSHQSRGGSQQNAIRTAQEYLDYTGFSRLGLIDQLEYEQYSTADATFAVDSLNVDFNAQAAKVAQAYLDYTGFSCQGLIDQLEYEQFTADQATFGARQVGLC
jgi:colicin import membrane protein